MAFNLLKKYNTLLEIVHMSAIQRTSSLKMVFERDIENNETLGFRGKKINPVKRERDSMQLLFQHLTTVTDKEVKTKRIFDLKRSERLHWVRYHVEEKKPAKIKVFSVEDPEGIRTYIFDEEERYVIVLAPYRDGREYYLLTAYHLEEKGNVRKINNKYNRRLKDLL